jgi:ribonuclease-3
MFSALYEYLQQVKNEDNKEKALEFIKDHHINIDNGQADTYGPYPSFIRQERNSRCNNQRLEFLGDAVLNLLVAEYLYKHFCDKAEGELTKIRAKVVCEKALVGFASRINLGNYILLGKGEGNVRWKAKESPYWLIPQKQ